MIELSATQILARLHAGETTAVEVASAFFQRIHQADGQVGAFLHVMEGAALQKAAEVDRRRQAGQPLGLLAGLPVALKDVLCTIGVPTTCASRMLENYCPPYDATVVKKLHEADAVVLGKTNMDEFAMGSSTENSALGTTRNPWHGDFVPGGSSGGAAACVAAGMAPLSIGTDTGGSIRQPAGFCGVVGLKPTYGRVSRYGLVAFASSLDQVGPIAGSVEDVALLTQAIAGHDPRDSTSAPVAVPSFLDELHRPLQGRKLGIVREHFGEGLDAEIERSVREAIRVYQSLGAQVVDVHLPHNQYAIATYYIIAPSEASSNLARYDGAHYGYRTDEPSMLAELAEQRQLLHRARDERGLAELDSELVRMYRRTRAEGFGAEVKRRIMLGTYALSAGYYEAYYLKALKVRRLIRQDYDAAFAEVDCLIGPVTPTAAYRAGEKLDDPLAMYLEDLYTVGANLAGIPAMSLPCGFTSQGLPIGLQLQARPWAEATLFQVGAAFQRETDWHRKRPLLT